MWFKVVFIQSTFMSYAFFPTIILQSPLSATYKLLPPGFTSLSFLDLHILQGAFVLDRGTDILDSAIYCGRIPAYCSSHCVARSSSGGESKGIIATSGIPAWGHWHHGSPHYVWWIVGYSQQFANLFVIAVIVNMIIFYFCESHSFTTFIFLWFCILFCLYKQDIVFLHYTYSEGIYVIWQWYSEFCYHFSFSSINRKIHDSIEKTCLWWLHCSGDLLHIIWVYKHVFCDLKPNITSTQK